MGKGDLRTRRGKIANGSFGKHRPRKSKKPTTKVEAVTNESTETAEATETNEAEA